MRKLQINVNKIVIFTVLIKKKLNLSQILYFDMILLYDNKIFGKKIYIYMLYVISKSFVSSLCWKCNISNKRPFLGVGGGVDKRYTTTSTFPESKKQTSNLYVHFQFQTYPKRKDGKPLFCHLQRPVWAVSKLNSSKSLAAGRATR